MLTDLLYIFGSGLAIFLAGANAAFLFNLGRSLTGWFTFKIVAIMLVMFYMAGSLFLGDPGPWRGSLGVLALAVDALALFWMWAGIERLRRAGVTGMIPIARLSRERAD